MRSVSLLAVRLQGGSWRQRGPDGSERETKDDRNMVLKLRNAQKKCWKRMPKVEEGEYEEMRGDSQYGQKIGRRRSVQRSSEAVVLRAKRSRRGSRGFYGRGGRVAPASFWRGGPSQGDRIKPSEPAQQPSSRSNSQSSPPFWSSSCSVRRLPQFPASVGAPSSLTSNECSGLPTLYSTVCFSILSCYCSYLSS